VLIYSLGKFTIYTCPENETYLHRCENKETKHLTKAGCINKSVTTSAPINVYNLVNACSRKCC